MSPARTASARARVLTAILVVAGVGLAVVGSVTFLVQRERLLSDMDARLMARVSGPSDFVTAASGRSGGTPSSAYDTTAELLAAATGLVTPGRYEISLAILDGEVVDRVGNPQHPAIVAQEQVAAAAVSAARTSPGTAQEVRTEAGPVRFVTVPVSTAADPAVGVFVLAADTRAELQPVGVAVATYWIATIIVLAATGIVGWFVIGRLLSPIRRIAETADAITFDDLSPRLSTEGSDEISDLTRTVNSMLDRLEGSVDVQRQLLDDVRHELKTPITIVRGHLEMMDPRDADDVAAARAIGIAELDRMTRLVEDIDLLAAASGEQFTLHEVDLAQLTARVGELVAVIPGHAWRVERRGTGTVMADQDRLLQAWLQLADNAAKYTPEDTPIEIGSAFTLDAAILWVRDHGPGVPPALRHRIFRRFDRAHGKRSVGGSGLGLAIVDAIAKGHGGHCSVTETPGGGATFTIHLPLPTAELPAPVRAGDVVLQREATG